MRLSPLQALVSSPSIFACCGSSEISSALCTIFYCWFLFNLLLFWTVSASFPLVCFICAYAGYIFFWWVPCFNQIASLSLLSPWYNRHGWLGIKTNFQLSWLKLLCSVFRFVSESATGLLIGHLDVYHLFNSWKYQKLHYCWTKPHHSPTSSESERSVFIHVLFTVSQSECRTTE